MPKARLSVPHRLPQAEALARVRTLLAQIRDQFGPQLTDPRETWTDSRGEISFRYAGFSVNGVIEVGPQAVDFEITFPFVGLPFKSKFESKIRDTALSILSA
jgi:hypothetical protein